MAATRKLVKVQERGQITLPVEFRRKWGLKAGDLVAVEETSTGATVVPQKTLTAAELDELGEVLRESGISMEEWIESAREIRAELVKELYGLDPDSTLP
jgi:AbrB family looped-hinge helix DNA binding protein